MKTNLLDQAACILVRIVARGVRVMPEAWACNLGARLGEVSCFFSRRRRVIYADLKAAFGMRFSERERRQIVVGHYRHLGQSVMEVIRFPLLSRTDIDRHIRIHGLERFEQTASQDRGAVLLTAHLGNFELLQIVSGVLGRPICVLAQDQKHPRLYEIMTELRASHGSVQVSRGFGIRDLLRALRRKELVGVLGDQSAGKHQGLILPIFARKTSIPTGAFELAHRSGAVVLPCFIVRAEKPGCHEIFIGEEIPCQSEEDEKNQFRKQVTAYVRQIEALISQYPEQWLWAKKRWKYTWTKRVLILSDGKAGHVKQSQAVAAQFASLKEQYGRPGVECLIQTMTVEFRSAWHRRLFYAVTPFFLPWAQGRLGWILGFFKDTSRHAIEAASADFIVSTGSSLIPLNLCLARDSLAKSVVIMKPPFPYNFFRYDLALVPLHDKGKVPDRALRTVLTPSLLDPEAAELACEKLKKELQAPSRVRIGVFLGGVTRRYRMEGPQIAELLSLLEAQRSSWGDYVLTTSRRTPKEVIRFLKENFEKSSACQKLVVAGEDTRPWIVTGMMMLCEILIVTEDSISMISEAVSFGKRVIVLNLGAAHPPEKHKRFREILEKERAVVMAGLDDLAEKIAAGRQDFESDLVRREQNRLRTKLQEIL